MRYLRELDESELRAIGLAAQRRVLAAHTSQQRAQEFEDEVETARRGERVATCSKQRQSCKGAAYHSIAAAITRKSLRSISLPDAIVPPRFIQPAVEY